MSRRTPRTPRTASSLMSWRTAVRSKHGPESPTTRHVLLTLATYMDLKGGSCFPSQETLAEGTALSERAVRKHLELADRDGWIIRTERTTDRGKQHDYQASLPDRVLGIPGGLPAPGAGSVSDLPAPGADSTADGGGLPAPGAADYRHLVPPISSVGSLDPSAAAVADTREGGDGGGGDGSTEGGNGNAPSDPARAAAIPQLEKAARPWLARDLPPKGDRRREAEIARRAAEIRPLIEDPDGLETAWHHPRTHEPIAWERRPALLARAVGYQMAGKRRQLRAALILVLQETFDPRHLRGAAPGTEAAAVLSRRRDPDPGSQRIHHEGAGRLQLADANAALWSVLPEHVRANLERSAESTGKPLDELVAKYAATHGAEYSARAEPG